MVLIKIQKEAYSNIDEYNRLFQIEYRKYKREISEKYICECGAKVGIFSKSAHLKTKGHREYEEFRDYPEYLEVLERFNNEKNYRRKYNNLSEELKRVKDILREKNIS